MSTYIVYVYYKHIILAMFLWKVQKLIVHEVLKLRPNRRPMTANEHLRHLNHKFQKEFKDVFQRYANIVCPDCSPSCCDGGFSRLSNLDCYIYGYDFDKGKFEYKELADLLQRFTRKISKYIRKPPKETENDIIYESCPNLTPSGCGIPIGNRPMACVVGVCTSLLAAFTEDDLRLYSNLMGRYAWFRSRCVAALIWHVLKE